MITQAPLLQVHNLHKTFGNLVALDDVSFRVHPKEVVGVAGRSGSGVTTLFKCLTNDYRPDSGNIRYKGRNVDPAASIQAAGIGAIHQQPELVEGLDVTTNIFLGQELGWSFIGGRYNIPRQNQMNEAATELLLRLNAPFIPIHETASNLSGENRQLVQIAHAMAFPRDLMLVDNPSVYLSIPYQKRLLQLISTWQSKGSAVLFGSTNLDHLFAVCDRILVMREGQLVSNTPTDSTTREEVVANLVGTRERNQRTPAIWALDSYYQAREQSEMLKHNQSLLERDIENRDRLNQRLVDQLAEQVKALDDANMALQDANRRLLTEREQERKHLAREIHDQPLQDLLSINYQLEDLGEILEREGMDTEEVEEIRVSIKTIVEDLRGICSNLRPPTIDSLGLSAALRSYTSDWSHRTGIPVDLTLNENLGRLPETLELSIFRIVQEALNNIWKHAGATKTAVALQPVSARRLLVTVTDNGKGMDTPFDLANLSNEGHYGLLGISERVALMGGRLRMQNGAESGTILQVELPHPKLKAKG